MEVIECLCFEGTFHALHPFSRRQGLIFSQTKTTNNILYFILWLEKKKRESRGESIKKVTLV